MFQEKINSFARQIKKAQTFTDRDSLGHSKVELVFDVFKKPTIKIPASKKRILALDLGFKGGFLYIFYRVDPDFIHCFCLKSQLVL